MSAEASSNPFPGPQPYRAADRGYFLGREDISRKLLNRILANPCVTLFGPSGSGKSSLMQASVIPLLMEQHGFRVARIDGWLAGEAPLERLGRAMFAQLELVEPSEELNPRELLDEALRLAERRSERPILIFLDQLEQPLLPDRPWEQLHELLEGLETIALTPLRGLQLVLSLREDYLGRYRDQVRGNRVLQDLGFRLGPLTVMEMAQVACAVLCREAAPLPQWSLEELRTLMLQVRTPGQSATDEAEVQAAYAQIVCRTIWEEQRSRDGLARPVEAELILHRYLDTTLDSLGPLRPAALRLLEDHLITRDGSRTLLTNREANDVLPAGAAARVLGSLERAAVLHSEQHQGGLYFELGHDWLAKKVLEFKRKRLREEEKARERQEALLRLQKERAAWRKLLILATVGTAVALLLSGLLIWVNAKAEMASTLTLLAGAREQLQQGQPALAAKLLAEVKNPEKEGQVNQDWKALTQEALNSNFLEVTLQGPSGETFNAASFSPDGQHIVTASDDGIARVWRSDNEGEPRALVGHRDSVTAAEFSPDGQLIVTASRDGTARVWRTADAALLRTFQHEGKGKNPVRSAGFSPDGRHIVTVFRDGSTWVWRTDDARQPLDKLSLGGLDKRINFAAFSPDREVPRIVTTSWDGTARVWQAANPWGPFRLQQELEGHQSPVTSAAFSPDGKRIVTASRDGTASVWQAANAWGPFALQQEFKGGHQGPVSSAAFSRDGRLIVTASQDGIARVWQAWEPFSLRQELKGHQGPVTSAAFDKSNEEDPRVVTASQDGTVRVWHADFRYQPIVDVVMQHKESVTHAGFSPDGKSIVTASLDGVARVWPTDRSESPIELRGHKALLTSVAFSPDPEVPRIVTSSWDGTVRVWEKRAEDWKESVSLEHPGPVQSAVFSPDGKSIVTASPDGVARVWLANGSKPDGVARVWLANGSKPPLELRGDEQPLTSAAFSPDGRFIVTASRDGTARVWLADGSGVTRTLRGHKAPVTSAAFSPDGRLIVTASQDGTARIWQADGSGPSPDKPLRELPHNGPILSAMFSPDGRFIVTTSWDATVRVWRTDGSEIPRVLKGHKGPVRFAAFSPDPNVQRIVTASWDRTARLWRLPEQPGNPTHGQLLQQLKERNRDCLPSAMRQRYLKEDEQEARRGYEQCEREHHRDPSS